MNIQYQADVMSALKIKALAEARYQILMRAFLFMLAASGFGVLIFFAGLAVGLGSRGSFYLSSPAAFVFAVVF